MLQTIKEAVDQAMTDPTSSSINWVHGVAEVVEGAEVVLAIAADAGLNATAVGVATFLEEAGASIAWPVTTAIAAVVTEFAALGAGYAEAATEIKESRSASGFSQGVVMGAFKHPVDFVKSRFFEWSPEQNTFWPEAGALAQHYYNAALALGYRYGFELDSTETQLFFTDLSQGLTAPLGDPESAPTEQDRENAWVDFYIAAGVQFQKLHIVS